MRMAELPPMWKELFIRFTVYVSFVNVYHLFVSVFFPFGFESGVWDLIVLVPGHCLSLYFSYSLSRLSVIFCTFFVAYINLLLVFASRFVILHLA